MCNNPHRYLRDPAFLVKEIATEAKYCRHLFADVAPNHPMPGEDRDPRRYFEPVRLFFCWCDYLGGLYLGSFKEGTRARVQEWLASPFMQERNEAYFEKAGILYRDYRNYFIHQGHSRAGRVSYEVGQSQQHLEEIENGALFFHIPTMLHDIASAADQFADNLKESDILAITFPD